MFIEVSYLHVCMLIKCLHHCLILVVYLYVIPKLEYLCVLGWSSNRIPWAPTKCVVCMVKLFYLNYNDANLFHIGEKLNANICIVF